MVKINGQSISLRKKMDLQSEIQKKAMENKMQSAAKMYERQFLREMVKAMRSTVKHSEMSKPTMAERIYKDKLYENYVNKWSERGGVGFADMIYQQLLDKYSPYHKKSLAPPQGPLPIDKKPKSIEILNNNTVKGTKLGASFLLESEKPIPIKSPWKGQVQSRSIDESGKTWLKITHENGLKSLLRFEGQGRNKLDKGAEVVAGETVGFLSPGRQRVLWQTSLV